MCEDGPEAASWKGEQDYTSFIPQHVVLLISGVLWPLHSLHTDEFWMDAVNCSLVFKSLKLIYDTSAIKLIRLSAI